MSPDRDYRIAMTPTPQDRAFDPAELLLESGLEPDAPELVGFLHALNRLGGGPAPTPSLALAHTLHPRRRVRPSRRSLAGAAAAVAVLAVGISGAAAASRHPAVGPGPANHPRSGAAIVLSSSVGSVPDRKSSPQSAGPSRPPDPTAAPTRPFVTPPSASDDRSGARSGEPSDSEPSNSEPPDSRSRSAGPSSVGPDASGRESEPAETGGPTGSGTLLPSESDRPQPSATPTRTQSDRG